MATETSDSDVEGHDVRKQRYRRLLKIIHANTGHPQHPMISARGLWTLVKHTNVSISDAKTALQAARENDHVIRWRDGSGKWRYGLTGDAVDELPERDSLPYDWHDEDALRDIIETEVAGEDPNEEIVGWANTCIAAIDEQRGGDDENV